jgi:Holliday junction DNA helicase RuvA
MFAKLTGIIDSIEQGQIVIDVDGVGYIATASQRTIDALPIIGQRAAVFIETRVREDAIQLFAFATKTEQQLFCLLQSVQGIGGKAALAILSALSPEQLIAAIASGDKAMVARADGVGPKLALRVVTELKDKAAKFDPRGFMTGGHHTHSPATANSNQGTLRHAEDAISALVNLGYARADAFSAVSIIGAELGPDAPVAKIIPAALKHLAA